MRFRWWYNIPMLWLLCSPIHRLVSHSTLALSIRGRTSGRTYTFPVNYLQHGFMLLVLSPRDRTWWRNLQTGALVTLWLRGQPIHTWAQASTDPTEVMKGLLVILRRSPMRQRALGIRLNQHGDPRQKVQLIRAAGRYTLIRIALPSPADARPVEASVGESSGGDTP